MTREVVATLECTVCGAGWAAGGIVIDEWPISLRELGEVFMADEGQECPECGEYEWDIAKPEGVN